MNGDSLAVTDATIMQDQPITDGLSLDQRAQRISNLVSVASKAIVEIGDELIAAKGEMPHGRGYRGSKATSGGLSAARRTI